MSHTTTSPLIRHVKASACITGYRTKQASAETSKLKTIQKELSHLDQKLNVDVSVIRDRIEEATRLYSEAR